MAVNEQHFADSLKSARRVPDVFNVCRQFAEASGFKHFVYAVRIPTSMTEPYHFSISGFPSEWRKRYDEMGYLRIDPIVAHVFSSLTPLIWDEIDGSDPAVAGFLADAARFGLEHGLTIPVYGRGGEISLFSLARSRALPSLDSSRLSLVRRAQWFATHVHEAVRPIIMEREDAPGGRGRLTAREKDCLLWAAEGKTAWEIAQVLSISERTVNFHLQNVRDKLQVQGSRNAVAKAIAMGELTSPAYGTHADGGMPVIHWHSAGSPSGATDKLIN
jgi:DNA-binding CsgD family transcriptional regulator